MDSQRNLLQEIVRAIASVVGAGPVALHGALCFAGVETEDKVLLPAMNFIATINVVNYRNATPHFIDSEERSLGMDAHAISEYL
jgi:perosamine synthetase